MSGRLLDDDGIDAGEGRGFGAKTREKSVDADGRPFDLDGDAVGVVADGAGELLFGGEAVDEGAEADALDYAADENLAAATLGAVVRFSI